jgi:hypothetical protein
MVMSPPSRRALYRVVYPLSERPLLTIGRVVHEVVDCSEEGLRYETRGSTLPVIGSQMRGVVRFHGERTSMIHGEVIRAARGIVVLALDPPLSFADIMAEQRYLRGKGYLRE